MTLDLRTQDSAPHIPAARSVRLGERLVSALLSIRTVLRRSGADTRARTRGSPPLSGWLRKDLGIPEVIEPDPYYWHHP